MKKTIYGILAGSIVFLSLLALMPPTDAQGNLHQASSPGPKQMSPTLYVYDFYATWCHNCTALRPTLEMVKRKYRGKVQVVPIDIDAPNNHQLVSRFGVQAVPLLVIVNRQGQALKSFMGADQAQELDSAIGMILNPPPKPTTVSVPSGT